MTREVNMFERWTNSFTAGYGDATAIVAQLRDLGAEGLPVVVDIDLSTVDISDGVAEYVAGIRYVMGDDVTFRVYRSVAE